MRRTITGALAGVAALGLTARPSAPPNGQAAGASATSGFTARVTNPYYPLLKGMRWEYRGVKDGRRLRDIIRVTGRVRKIAGVPCAVVDDRTWLDGRLAERTTDWYTQDTAVRSGTSARPRASSTVTATSRAGGLVAGGPTEPTRGLHAARARAGQSFAQEHVRATPRTTSSGDLHSSVTVPFTATATTRSDARVVAAGARREGPQVVRQGRR